MARRSSGFVQDLRDADKALSSILPKVEAFSEVLKNLGARPPGGSNESFKSSMGGGGSGGGGGGVNSESLKSSRGGGSGGGGVNSEWLISSRSSGGAGYSGSRRDLRANPRVGGGGYVDIPTYLSNTTGRSTAPAAQVSAGEAEIVNVLGAVVTELKKIRTGSDADGLRLRVGGQS